MNRKKKRIIWISCLLIPVVLAAVVLISFGGADNITIQLSLNGERIVTLSYGESYTDPGASAVLLDTDSGQTTETAVTVSGVVDTSKIGTYTIRYTASSGNRIGTVYRQVKVVDNQAPSIVLVSDPDHYTLPGCQYEEEGFTAYDAYDGDLTDQVRRIVTDTAVIYTVSDSSGNRTSVTRPIVFYDPIAPELKLYGDTQMIINMGTSYVEPGFVANDNCDGDLTNKVQISGTLNTFKPGRYTLKYTVTDSFGNTTSVTRIVSVKARDVQLFNNPNVGNKFIYLTFDDGPGPKTPELLDVLARYNVPATFFVVETGCVATITRAAQEGHTIAIHTASHDFNQIYASEEAYFADLYRMQEIIQNRTGILSTLIRFPGGSSNTVSSFNKGIMTRLVQQVTEKGFTYFDWNVDSKDAGGARTAKQVYNNVVKGIGSRTNSVVLMHDIKSYTIDAIECIIIWGLENGYTFRGLTEDAPTCHHGVNN